MAFRLPRFSKVTAPKPDPTKLAPGQLERLRDKIKKLRANMGDLAYSPKTGFRVPTASRKTFKRFDPPGGVQLNLPYKKLKPSGPGGGAYSPSRAQVDQAKFKQQQEKPPTRFGRDK